MSLAVTYLARDTWVAQARAKTLPADAALRKGHAGVTLGASFHGKAIDTANRVVPLVISTSAVDRSHDVVTQAGWDLADFKSIPTILFGHDHWSFPIGQGLETAVVGERLITLAQFATRDESPDADTAFKLIAGGYLRGVSAGFKPTEWTYDEERNGVNYLQQLLLEASMVPVPDNQECAALKAAKAAGIDLAPWRVRAEKALDTKAAPDDLADWFTTLYCLGGSTMKGKTIHVGQVLGAALAKAVTPEQSRETLIAAMAEKASTDAPGIEAILKGEAEGLSLTALDAVAGVVAASLDEVVVAAAADVTPETPAAPPPTPPADAPADAKAFVAAMQANTAIQEKILAELQKRPVTPTPPPAKADDGEFNVEKFLAEQGDAVTAAIERGATRAAGDSLTSVTGRLPQ